MNITELKEKIARRKSDLTDAELSSGKIACRSASAQAIADEVAGLERELAELEKAA